MPSRLNAGTYNAFAGWIEVVAGHKPIKQRVVHLCAGRFPSPAPPGPHKTLPACAVMAAGCERAWTVGVRSPSRST